MVNGTQRRRRIQMKYLDAWGIQKIAETSIAITMEPRHVTVISAKIVFGGRRRKALIALALEHASCSQHHKIFS